MATNAEAVSLKAVVLRDQVKDVLLQRIVDGEYAPGQRLVETQIARELSCSQAPVREALRDLEQLGCVAYAPNRGCSVRAFSHEELLEAYPVRAALEGLAAEQAAGRIDDRELAQLGGLVAEMRACAERGDAHEQARANVRFHATIVRAARNRTLERQWNLLEPFARTYLTVARAHMDLEALAARHEPILDALRRRDATAAAETMRAHLLEAADLLRQASTPAEPSGVE
jgi:DNA-binding GntR family transcriptional regulator